MQNETGGRFETNPSPTYKWQMSLSQQGHVSASQRKASQIACAAQPVHARIPPAPAAQNTKAAFTDDPGGTGSRHCSLSFACPRPPGCIEVCSRTESRSNGKPQENFDLLQGPMLTAQDFSLTSQGHPRRRMPGGLSMGHAETCLEVAINASS